MPLKCPFIFCVELQCFGTILYVFSQGMGSSGCSKNAIVTSARPLNSHLTRTPRHGALVAPPRYLCPCTLTPMSFCSVGGRGPLSPPREAVAVGIWLPCPPRNGSRGSVFLESRRDLLSLTERQAWQHCGDPSTYTGGH